MKPSVVVDVGNTRIKWGRCSENGVSAMASLPGDDPSAWQRQLEHWQLPLGLLWAVSGVHPSRREMLVGWLRDRGGTVQVLDSWTQLKLKLAVERPEQVGLDRLFNVIAAASRITAGTAALVIDAGTAITVNWLDESGSFRGGAILPGMSLMSRALHENTAQLPHVNLPTAPPTFPGTSTTAAIEAGIFWSAVGGVQALRQQFDKSLSPAHPREIFLTGGDAWLLAPLFPGSRPPWPEMTLEGVRLAAEALS